MKVKEKWANEAMDRIVKYGDVSVPYCAWIDGFEKARDMAIDLAMKWNRKDFEKLKGTTYIHDMFPSQKISFIKELKSLGEEEV